MARPRVVSLEEKCEWMRRRQQLKAQEAVPSPPKKGPSMATVQRARREVPARFIMYRVSEVAEFFGVSDDTIRHWFKDTAVVKGETRRIFLISQQALDEFIEAHRGA